MSWWNVGTWSLESRISTSMEATVDSAGSPLSLASTRRRIKLLFVIAFRGLLVKTDPVREKLLVTKSADV